jgi:hypothetical protein
MMRNVFKDRMFWILVALVSVIAGVMIFSVKHEIDWGEMIREWLSRL